MTPKEIASLALLGLLVLAVIYTLVQAILLFKEKRRREISEKIINLMEQKLPQDSIRSELSKHYSKNEIESRLVIINALINSRKKS